MAAKQLREVHGSQDPHRIPTRHLLVNSIGRLADEELGARKVAMHMRFSTFSSSDSMTRHGVNLVLSIGACELAPGAPRLQGARPLGNRGMSLLGTFETCRDVRSAVAIGGKADIAKL
jgi:hypothetical protein